MVRLTRVVGLAGIVVALWPTGAAADARGPVSSTWTVECNNDIAPFEATSVFFPAPGSTPHAPGGATSTFHIVGSTGTAIVFTPGTDRFADATCVFSLASGKSPAPWFAEQFEADVYFPPR